MAEEILRLKPNQVVELIQQGKMEVVTSAARPAVPELSPQSSDMEERAKNLLGKDFLGKDAVVAMENKLKALGLNVEFDLDNIPNIPFDQKDLEIAKQSGEILVLRAGSMTRDGIASVPISILGFRELFRRDPNGGTNPLIYSFKQSANDWYKDQDFAKRGSDINLGWALVKKEVLPGSTNKTWGQQEEVLKQYKDQLTISGATHKDVRRRTPMEVMWDTLLYYANTNDRLLPDKYDWTAGQTSDGTLVLVGWFDSDGLLVSYWSPEGQNPDIGVCPSR